MPFGDVFTLARSPPLTLPVGPWGAVHILGSFHPTCPSPGLLFIPSCWKGAPGVLAAHSRVPIQRTFTGTTQHTPPHVVNSDGGQPAGYFCIVRSLLAQSPRHLRTHACGRHSSSVALLPNEHLHSSFLHFSVLTCCIPHRSVGTADRQRSGDGRISSAVGWARAVRTQSGQVLRGAIALVPGEAVVRVLST